MEVVPSTKKPTSSKRVHVEVCLGRGSKRKRTTVVDAVTTHLQKYRGFLHNGRLDISRDSDLSAMVQSVNICLPEGSSTVSLWEADFKFHTFRLIEGSGDSNDDVEEDEDEDDEGGDRQDTHDIWNLPSKEFHPLWDSLKLEPKVKENLLRFCFTSMLFAEKKVDPYIVSCNRVVLLYGPPGTGKTTLCKALAQKLSIRLSKTFPKAIFMEINAHSLFSKWFSESGKLVMKLFDKVHAMVEVKDQLVFVLIDEVESLATVRQQGSAEPSDAIRAVNALLTQLDRLKIYENVVILATSNITGAIDIAFLDRADIKQYIGLPGEQARLEILRSCLVELERRGVLGDDSKGSNDNTLRFLLERLSKQSKGLSGRTLRKLPFKCHAYFGGDEDTVSMVDFMKDMEKTIAMEFEERKRLSAQGEGAN
ncbi:hypothetical protein AAMO2058_000168500 [Amorphochlora amoebiformis]